MPYTPHDLRLLIDKYEDDCGERGKILDWRSWFREHWPQVKNPPTEQNCINARIANLSE